EVARKTKVVSVLAGRWPPDGVLDVADDDVRVDPELDPGEAKPPPKRIVVGQVFLQNLPFGLLTDDDGQKERIPSARLSVLQPRQLRPKPLDGLPVHCGEAHASDEHG